MTEAEELAAAIAKHIEHEDPVAVELLLATSADATDADVLTLVAWTYRWLGDAAAALAAAERALHISETERAYYVLAHILLEVGEWRMAVARAEAGARKFPSSVLANLAPFEVLVAIRATKKAHDAAAALAMVAPESREALIALCWSSNERRRFPELFKRAQKGRELYPDEPEFLIYLGRSFHGRQRIRQALDHYYQACLAQPWRQLPRTLLRQAEQGYFASYFMPFFFAWLMLGTFSLFLFHLPRQAALIVLLVPIPVAILLQRYTRNRFPSPIVRITQEESKREAREFAAHLRRQFSWPSSRSE